MMTIMRIAACVSTSVLLVSGAVGMCAEALEQEAAVLIGEITKAVEQLPEATTEHKLKKAVLRWGLEDARASLDAGLGTAAKAVLVDVQAHLAQDIGRRAQPPKELLPPVTDFANNPYAQGVVGRVRSVLHSNTLYKKGDEG